MKRNIIILFGLLCLLSPTVAWSGQACSEDIPASPPDENFAVGQDGTVLGKNTGLVWMRCSVGQSWTGQSCKGEGALLTWAQALKAADGYQYGGFNDWRLPNKNELESIVELSCSSPAINEKLFPAAPSAFFWSASPYSGVGDGAWSVDFAYGAVVASVKSGNNHVRLVRDR